MRLSLLQKMGVIVLAVTLSFLILMAVTWFLGARMTDRTETIRDEYIPLVELGYRLDTKFDSISLQLRDAVSAQDMTGLEDARVTKDQLFSDLDSASKILAADQIQKVKEEIDGYFTVAFDTSKRLIEGEMGLPIVDSMHVMQDRHRRAELVLNKISSFDRTKLSEAFNSIFVSQKRSANIQLWIGFLCVFFTLLITSYIARSMILQLSEIARGLNRYGAGDFKNVIPVTGTDELADLSHKINNMADRIQSLMKELESFSYSIAHDLRAPLRSVAGFSDDLLHLYSEQLPDDGKELLKRIIASEKRMSLMVAGLLSISRLNRAPINKEMTDLSQIVRRSIGVLQNNDPSSNVEVSIEENVKAWGDPQLLDMAISNLVGNAWKFTKKTAKPKIQFGTKKEGDEVVYFIKDNGAGFDMNYSEKLFGTFQRLHTENEFEGHGIGLATVKNIIDKHGGRIWAEGQTDKGATFYFTLGALAHI